MRITVVGLGYIGLPTALMFATHGHYVHGYDIRTDIVTRLQKGEVPIDEPGLPPLLRDALASGHFKPSARLEAADAYIICVPTPVDHASHQADLSYVHDASKAIVPLLKKGDLVVLESTVPAGTTERVVAPILEAGGLKAGADVLVAHCPETVLPGRILHELVENQRIVGGTTPAATKAAARLYASFVRSPVLETTATNAELAKLLQNTYRDVNIALANELALICEDLGADAREVIRLANTHPRVQVHQPGPGVGGHCIPVDPWFLAQASPRARLIPTARAVNDAMPDHVVRLARAALDGVAGPKIAVLGLAYKGNVDDIRESPSLEVVHGLERALPGAKLVLHDPHVPARSHPTRPLDEALQGADLIVITTDHDEYRRLDPATVARQVRARRVVDTRAVLARDRWSAQGFQVWTI